MKAILLQAFSFLILTSLSLNSKAQGSNTGSWSKKFGYQKAFIENKGQFSIPDAFGNPSPVLFAVDHGGTKIYFTKKGITYTFLESTKKKKDERELARERREEFRDAESHAKFEKEEHEKDIKSDYVTMLWQNSNSNVNIESTGMTSDYHSYSFKNTSGNLENISNIKGFQKIIYKNIYPNIDIEYVFHEKGGLKYSLTLHPGANPALVKMIYNHHVNLTNEGEIQIRTKFGNIIDHAPLSFYQQNTTSIISSNFIKTGKTVSFQLNNYDNTQTIIIDPWTQTPAFTSNWDCVWECEKDGSGNVYIIGGVSPMQLLKYNSTGALQWTYNTPYDTSNCWLGTFATDNLGNSYVTRGSTSGIQKISTAGALIWNNNGGGGSIGNSDEYWNISFNCDQTKLIVGGTTGAFGLPPVLKGAIFDINTSNGAILATKTVAYGSTMSIPPSIQEVRSITPCGNGRYYFLTLDSIGYINQNFNLCGPSNSAIFKTTSTHGFSYKCENFRSDNTGIMAIRADANFVYTHNGTTLFKRSLANAAIIATVSIPGGAATTSFGQKAVSCSGIDIDAAGNIYVGSTNAVTKFSPALVQLATAAVPFNVYDVHVSTAGDVIASGSTGNSGTASRAGYIQSISSLTAGNILSLTCCDVNICQPPNVCSTAAAFNLQAATPGGTWGGTGITNTSTGTFNPATAGVGSHVITYSLACGVGSITVNVLSCGTVTLCLNGSTLNVGGGSGTYTLASTSTSVSCASCPGGNCIPFICSGTTVPTWSATGTSVAAPASTVFPIKVTDTGTGTTFTFTTLGSIPACSTPSCPTLSLSVTSQTNVNCFGANTGTATVNVTGGTGPYTYTWTPGNLSGASQTALSAGTYTIAIKDANNCSGTGTLTITQPTAALNAVVSATTITGCGSSTGGATVTASGGTPSYSYSWSPSGGTTAGVSNLAAGNNTVTVTDSKGCTKTAVAIITTAGGPTLSVASQTNINCFGSNTGTATVNPTGGTGPYTYTWTPGNLSGASQTGLAAGIYTINVKDANQCTGTTTLTITQPTSAVSAVITATSATGCGTSTGGATVTASGGTPSYTYSWIPSGGTTAGVSNLGSGSNSVTVTDALGCTVTAVANIITAGGPTLSVVSQASVNCFGASTGSATVQGNGGTAPYTYTWNPGNLNGASQTGLAAGTYTINITDAGLCAGSGTLLITQPTSSLSANITATTAAGCGSSSVSIFWTENFGVGCSQNQTANGFNPSVNGAWAVTNTGLNDPSANQWYISATESGMGVGNCGDGCLGAGTTNRTLHVGNVPTSPAAFIFCPSGDCGAAYDTGIGANNVAADKRAESPTINCSGQSNITLSFNYIEGGQTTLDDATLWYFDGSVWSQIDNMPKTATCGSGQGLWASRTLVLPASANNNANVKIGFRWVNNDDGAGADPSFAVDDITLSASSGTGSLGGATVTASGGTSPYSYNWSPTGGTTAGVNNLPVGNNTVTVTDNVGCSVTAVANITSAGGPTLSVASQTNVNCFGASTGSASINATGGTGPFTYTWTPGNLSGSSQTALSAGTYTINVTDANSCASSTTVLITQPTASLSASISNTTAPGCGTSNGSASVTASGGTPGYSYAWTPNGGTTASVNNLAAGNSTVTVTDSKGCTVSSVVSLASTSGPTLSVVAQTSVTCFGGNNGTANVSATGGTGPYTYTWTPGNLTGATQNSLSAGVYTVTVKDANQCAGTGTVSIIQPAAGVTGTISTTPTGCGTSVGSATVTASGGTPAYTYTWGPTAGSGTSISGLAAGSYSVKITDSKGCTVTVNASINTTGTGPTLSVASQTNGTCGNVANGAATINASGTSPYTYTWSPSGGNAATATGLAGGTYTVLVADASLCVSTITINITQPPPIVLTVTSTPANCGFYDGTATASATGGNGTLTYLWSTNTNSATASGLSSGTYSVLVTDATGCTATGFTNVNSVGTLTVDVGSNVTIFEGQSTQLNALIPFGANVVWTPTTGLSCTTCSNPIASPTVSTDYCALTTIGSCTNISCVSVFVEIDCASNSDYSAPNAFSPNGDGINDNFCLEGWKKCVTTFYVGIYNKWGEKVYESEEADFCWDGTFRGKALNPDVFVYYIKATIKDVGEILRKGNVTLVK
ncbi:MAG: gliding motility-associated C-terminal domain-containing protein [Bacteroidia bacterium]